MTIETILLSIILFVLYYGVLQTVFLPAEPTTATSINPCTKEQSAPQQTIQKAHTIYPEDVFKLLDETPDTIDQFVQSLTLLKARKVAKSLSIKQTVTNNKQKKDKSLSWLKREIKQRLISIQDTEKLEKLIINLQAA